MGDRSWERIEAILDKALTLPEHKRSQYITYACEGNENLKTEVTLMLESITASEGWLENPADYKEIFYNDLVRDVERLEAGGSLLGQKVGVYTIREELGAGGMGTVYKAERTDGSFDHQVAIKVIRHGRATETNIRRFERERNILAGLNHPGIAPLYGGGITDDGFPYLIMEYVQGEAIDEYCQTHNCTVDERIDLFMQVLKAVRHAHENMVVHRDLKPSNIMVTSRGVVKILDFGISKMLEDEEDLDLTQTKARMLTPRYAAPEQILHQPVTMGTDLYTLGVLLYQMLAGSPAYDMEDKSLHEAERMILNETPTLPSKSVTPDAAQKRRTDQRTLAKKLNGDLDAIVMKAIRKEPEARYRTANDFLTDLDNYRNNWMVSAHADTMQYRAGKMYKRHKKSLIAGTVFFSILLALFILHSVRVTAERNQANFEARKSKQVKEFLVGILRQADPFQRDVAGPVTLGEVLERGKERVRAKLSGQPAVRADLLLTMAQVYSNLGQYPQTEQLAAQALDLSDETPDPHFRAAALNTMATAIAWQSRYQEADSLFSRALEVYRATQKTDSSLISGLYNNWGFILQEQGREEEAKNMLLKAIALKGNNLLDDYNDAITFHNLGETYSTLAQTDSAIHYYSRALDIERNIVGEEHPMTANTMSMLGATYYRSGNLSKAHEYQRRSLAIKKRRLPAGHPHISASQVRLAQILIKQGQPVKADSLVTDALSILRNHFPQDHWRLVAAQGVQAVARAAQGRFNEAEQPLLYAFNLFEQRFGIDDWRTREAAKALVGMYRGWGKQERAQRFMQVLQAK